MGDSRKERATTGEKRGFDDIGKRKRKRTRRGLKSYAGRPGGEVSKYRYGTLPQRYGAGPGTQRSSPLCHVMERQKATKARGGSFKRPASLCNISGTKGK